MTSWNRLYRPRSSCYNHGMKQLTIFEASIIGFFVGVISSTYILFLSSNEAFIGNILGYISLEPLFPLLNIPDSASFIGQFLFHIIVFTLYGSIVGIILKYFTKPRLIGLSIALIIIAGTIEQTYISSQIPNIKPSISYQVANINKSLEQQYFGTEAQGDLNNDGKQDVAFIIHRKDKDRGTLYYLTSALATDNGKTGTNLIFLGEKIEPKQIYINDNTIVIDYTHNATTSTIHAFIQDGELVQLTSTSTEQK